MLCTKLVSMCASDPWTGRMHPETPVTRSLQRDANVWGATVYTLSSGLAETQKGWSATSRGSEL